MAVRAKLATWITVGAWVLTGIGCSSIAARTKARDAKLYPGIRNFDPGGEGPGTDPAAGMLATIDLVLSAATDTLLLPIDALHRPKGTRVGPTEYTQGTYAGLYWFGFERSHFAFLGGRERWWLTGDIEGVTRRMGSPSLDKPELHNPVFLVVEGDLSRPGHYGHMGAYSRELHVTKVLELQQMSPDMKR
jgi:uncharacterized protein YceK